MTAGSPLDALERTRADLRELRLALRVQWESLGAAWPDDVYRAFGEEHIAPAVAALADVEVTLGEVADAVRAVVPLADDLDYGL